MWTSGGQLDLHTFQGLRGGGKGGGNSQPPPPPIYTDPVNGMSFSDDPYAARGYGKTGAQKLNEEITSRKAQEQQTSDAAKAQSTSDAAAKETAFQGSRQSAYDTALQSAIRAFQLQGADPNAYMQSDIQPALQRQFNSIQDLDPNPQAAFPSNLGDTIVNQVLGGKRTQATNALNSVFTPNYAANMVPDTLTGQYSSDILNEQFNPLMTQLQNAQRRGTLTDPGYGAAMDLLNQKRTAAQATINNLGQGIISADRSGLNDYITGARGDVNSLGLASSFDPSTYAGEAGRRAQTDIANFGGALRNAVGGTKFADINELINAGGAAQGDINPNAANPMGPAIAGSTSPSVVAQDELAKRTRGLGSTGSF
jgi:hypothetical protein